MMIKVSDWLESIIKTFPVREFRVHARHCVSKDNSHSTRIMITKNKVGSITYVFRSRYSVKKHQQPVLGCEMMVENASEAVIDFAAFDTSRGRIIKFTETNFKIRDFHLNYVEKLVARSKHWFEIYSDAKKRDDFLFNRMNEDVWRKFSFKETGDALDFVEREEFEGSFEHDNDAPDQKSFVVIQKTKRAVTVKGIVFMDEEANIRYADLHDVKPDTSSWFLIGYDRDIIAYNGNKYYWVNLLNENIFGRREKELVFSIMKNNARLSFYDKRLIDVAVGMYLKTLEEQTQEEK
jgi:hypothetical protein